MSVAELVMMMSLHSQHYWGFMTWPILDVHFSLQTLLILWLDHHSVIILDFYIYVYPDAPDQI